MQPQSRRALLIAAERIGAAAFKQQYRQHLRAGRKPKTFRFDPPQCQRDIITALNEDVDDDSAMSLVWTYDAMQYRLR